MAKSITVKQAGRKGGKARTKKKALAARKNGKKGGRPKALITMKEWMAAKKLCGEAKGPKK